MPQDQRGSEENAGADDGADKQKKQIAFPQGCARVCVRPCRAFVLGENFEKSCYNGLGIKHSANTNSAMIAPQTAIRIKRRGIVNGCGAQESQTQQNRGPDAASRATRTHRAAPGLAEAAAKSTQCARGLTERRMWPPSSWPDRKQIQRGGEEPDPGGAADGV